MEHFEFVQKYNDFNIDFNLESMPYFELLIHLHTYLFGKDKVRCEEKYQRRINNLIQNVMISDFSNMTLYTLSETLSKCISSIWLYQPFFDGNTRTVILLLKLFALVKGYEFRYDMSAGNEEDYKKFVSLIYSEKDMVSEESIQKIKEHLYKVN